MPTTAYELIGGHVVDIWEEDGSGEFRSQKTHGTMSPGFISRHKNSFSVAGDWSNTEVPSPRFHSLKDAGKNLFQVEKGENNTWKIKNVPLYKAHPDQRKYGVTCDQTFLDRMVKNFYATKSATTQLFGDSRFSWLPKLHYGHTPNNPDMPERSNAGFIDNLFRVEDFLFGDIIALDKHDLEKLVSGAYPDRSAEVDIKRGRLLSVAALGFRTPHFAVPQMRADQLRVKYQALVAKHDFDETVTSQVFLGEDLTMPSMIAKNKRAKQVIDPDLAAKFFIRCQTDDDFAAKFEALKDEAISKHCEMYGSQPQMQGGSGGGLMQIIQQIMQQMMGQKMNQSQPGMGGQGGTQMNASDVLDMESAAHHDASDDEWEEEETETAGPDDTGIRKGKGPGDSEVDDMDGKASDGESEEGGDTIDEGGNVVKHVMRAKTTIKHVLGKIKDKHVRDQIGAAFDEVTSTVEALGNLTHRQYKALSNLSEDNARQRHARRKENFTSRLEKMFASGNPNVASREKIKKHLAYLMDESDERAVQYLANLEDVASIPVGRKISRNESIRSTDDDSYESSLNRAKHSLDNELRPLKKFIKPEHLAIVEQFDAMDLENEVE